MKWIVLGVAGLFSVFASYAHGKYGPAWDKPPSYTISQVEAVNRLAVDAGVAFKIQPSHDCGLDMTCLLAWAEEQHPKQRRRP